MGTETQHPAGSPRQTQKLLLADATPLSLGDYAQALGAAGYEVVCAPLSETAMAQAAEAGFAAVLVPPEEMQHAGPLLARLSTLMPKVPVVVLTAATEGYGLHYLSHTTDSGAFVAALDHILRPVNRAPVHAVAQRTAAIAAVPYGLQEEFDVALATLYMAYQPIVDCAHGQLFGYEALVRCQPGNLASPPALLAAAESLGQLQALSRQIRAQVARNLSALPPHLLTSRFFVNLHAQDLLDAQLYDPEAPLSAHAHRIVLEITERTPLDEVPEVQGRIERLRGMGYRIALDDLGAGYSGLSTFAQLEPEVVKLDMALVRQVEKSRTKRHIILSLVQLCEKLNIHVIAEGIETIAERDVLMALGCQLLQGYYFGRPEREWAQPTF